jgi:hypothetical protein
MEFEGPTRRLIAYPCCDNNVLNMCAFVSMDTSRTTDPDLGMQFNLGYVQLG